MKFIDKQDLKKYWNIVEIRKNKPRNLRRIVAITYGNFIKILKDNNKIKKIINNLYSGDFYIIKNVIRKNEIERLKKDLIDYSKKKPSSFFKILENCPNFWRRQDEDIAKKYSFVAVRDSFYFFRWNKEKLGIFKLFNPIWRYIKYLSGLNFDEYEKNTPKDVVVDRVQIVKYPEDSGYTVPHVHDPINQRLIISIYFSQKGLDYSSGGTYFYKNNKKINLENKIDVGDAGIFYATLKHGVDPVKIKSSIKVKDYDYRGRWWCGLYSPESNHKIKRHTSSPAK
jgi:hypothetical protein